MQHSVSFVQAVPVDMQQRPLWHWAPAAVAALVPRQHWSLLPHESPAAMQQPVPRGVPLS